MADNISVTPGSGSSIGTDETVISGNTVQVQRITLGAGPNIATGNIAVTASATPTAQALFGASVNDNAKERMFQPIDGDIYVGGAGVTTSNGFKVPSGTIIGTNAIAAIYAVSASGTVNIRTWEVT